MSARGCSVRRPPGRDGAVPRATARRPGATTRGSPRRCGRACWPRPASARCASRPGRVLHAPGRAAPLPRPARPGRRAPPRLSRPVPAPRSARAPRRHPARAALGVRLLSWGATSSWRPGDARPCDERALDLLAALRREPGDDLRRRDVRARAAHAPRPRRRPSRADPGARQAATRAVFRTGRSTAFRSRRGLRWYVAPFVVPAPSSACGDGVASTCCASTRCGSSARRRSGRAAGMASTFRSWPTTITSIRAAQPGYREARCRGPPIGSSSAASSPDTSSR